MVLDFSRPKKRSVVISGHKTSFTLEDVFWNILKKIASRENLSLARFIMNIDEMRCSTIMLQKDKAHIGGLSTALRVVVLKDIIENPDFYRQENIFPEVM